ncbi:MAG: preprotein translocase subunit YajC [Clostridia bacterium]|nr:preprotein translocase subunit YajC [Clostridia bacterium]
MLTSLLIESGQIFTYVILGVLLVGVVGMLWYSSKKRKKQEKESKDLIDAVRPGNKVKTIGGICGIVVEVDNDENTFVLETGTEASGKCFIKFDKLAIYQTDAVVEGTEDKKEEKVEAEKVEEAPAEPFGETVEANAQAPAESTENGETELKH